MKNEKKETRKLRILAYAEQPDVFLVVSDASEPDALPVIPTSMAESYWAHPYGVETPSRTRYLQITSNAHFGGRLSKH
jgi:hypothetical protein